MELGERCFRNFGDEWVYRNFEEFNCNLLDMQEMIIAYRGIPNSLVFSL